LDPVTKKRYAENNLKKKKKPVRVAGEKVDLIEKVEAAVVERQV
jgi:hypothetical protein